MSFRKIVFDGANVRAADHAAIFAGVLADGILKGCELSVSSSEHIIGMSKGFFIGAGRLIENNSSTVSFNYNPSSGSVVQIKLRIDISSENNVLDNGIVVTYGTSATDPNFTLTKQDINGGSGTVYDVELILVDTTSGSIIRKMPVSARPIHVIESVPTGNDWTGYSDGIYLVKQETVAEQQTSE